MRLNAGTYQILNVPLAGGICDSVFKKTRVWLYDKRHKEIMIKFCCAHEYVYDYDSFMDFVFISFFPSFKRSCFKFYKGRGKPLRDIMSEEQVLFFDDLLLKRCKEEFGSIVRLNRHWGKK